MLKHRATERLGQSKSRTLWHEERVVESCLNLLIKCELMEVEHVTLSYQLTKTATHIGVLRKGDVVSRGDLQDLMFTVTIESLPLDALDRAHPIEDSGVTLMTND
jgi:hypothetical protein